MSRGPLALVGAVLLAGGSAAAVQNDARITSLTLFAGTAEGLWRTDDWGARWTRVVGNPSGVRVDTIGAVRAVLPRGPEVYVAGDAGLFVSTDFGDTWQVLSATGGIRSLLLSRWPQADPTVFAGTDQGLLRSRDGGRTFEPTALGGASVDRLEWPGPALVVASARGVLVTTDEGRTLSGPGPGLPEGAVRAIVLSSFFGADPVAFAAPESGGVYRSGDGGATWSPAGLAGERVSDLVWLGPFLYAAGSGGLHRSEDAGRSWTRLSLAPAEPRRLVFPLAPAAGLEAFLATSRGVYHTADAGQSWRPAGLDGQDVFVVATYPSPDTAVGTGRPR